MYLLIDECCGKALVGIAEELGHTAQRTQEIQVLGGGADDRAIFDFARAQSAVFVTVNGADFINLASRGRAHSGVILLPSVRGRHMARLFRTVLPVAAAVLGTTPNLFVEIDETGRIRSFQLPPPRQRSYL